MENINHNILEQRFMVELFKFNRAGMVKTAPDTLLVCGGYNSESDLTPLKKACLFNIPSRTLTQLDDMKLGRANFGIVHFKNQNHNKVFVIGGIDKKGNQMKNCEYFDLNTGKWVEISPLTEASCGTNVFIYRDCLWVVSFRPNETLSLHINYKRIEDTEWNEIDPKLSTTVGFSLFAYNFRIFPTSRPNQIQLLVQADPDFYAEDNMFNVVYIDILNEEMQVKKIFCMRYRGDWCDVFLNNDILRVLSRGEDNRIIVDCYDLSVIDQVKFSMNAIQEEALNQQHVIVERQTEHLEANGLDNLLNWLPLDPYVQNDPDDLKNYANINYGLRTVLFSDRRNPCMMLVCNVCGEVEFLPLPFSLFTHFISSYRLNENQLFLVSEDRQMSIFNLAERKLVSFGSFDQNCVNYAISSLPGLIFFIGGEVGFTVSKRVFCLDLTENKLDEVGSLIKKREHVIAFKFEGDIFVTGEELATAHNEPDSISIEVYNNNKKRWEILGLFLPLFGSITNIVSHQNRIYFWREQVDLSPKQQLISIYLDDHEVEKTKIFNYEVDHQFCDSICLKIGNSLVFHWVEKNEFFKLPLNLGLENGNEIENEAVFHENNEVDYDFLLKQAITFVGTYEQFKVFPSFVF